jgi:dihydrofolate reductase
MRKLKLQVQMTVDGFVAGPEGQLDWMTFDMDEKLLGFINHLTDTSDTILLGRKMTEGFIKYWEHVVTQPASPEYEFGQKMVRLPKIVFSRTKESMEGKNVRVEKGPLVDAVNRIKSQAGKDIIVYGGATFVSSLIEHRLIDELNLFINPVAITKGMRIFSQRTPLTLVTSVAYASGIVVNTYKPA